MLSREGAVTGVTQSVTPAKRHTGMHCVVQGPVHEGARPDACCRARLERATPEVEGFSLPFFDRDGLVGAVATLDCSLAISLPVRRQHSHLTLPVSCRCNI